MQITEFKSIVTTFADPGSDLVFDSTHFGISMNGDLITAKITAKSGDVYVDEGTGAEPASKWVLARLARLPLLASRLRETVPATEHFVSPAVTLLPTLERGPDESPIPSNDGLKLTLETLDQRSPLETMVLYLTSDAGEGKTSLINQLAREQAQRFIDNKSDWLLVPIPLGGRPFLRFDDITVGVMQNRYRFPFLYFQSFLALVKMGVIVPAFDGFEEMFVETSSGEALSAMGILVSSLDSRGAMVVAARKAYYEFEDLGAKERLHATIKDYAVGFGKLELHRWTKAQFIDYCINRGIENAEELYRRVSERISPNHALLTRAVLVKRLADVVIESPSLDDFLEQLHMSGADYLSVFVRGLIERLIVREANEKWLDRSGEKEVGTPLLTVDEHCELLSHIALAMWEAKVDYLKRDALEFVADYFCETRRKNARQAQQIRERIRGHAMLIPSPNANQAVEFDHDEFRFYFLGEGIARQIRPMNSRAKAEVLGTLRRAPVPNDAMQALFRALTRDGTLDRVMAVNFLLEVASMDAQASYTHENIADLVIHVLCGIDGKGVIVTGHSFGHDALRDKKVSGVTFQNCYFSNTSLDLAELTNCTFIDCKFTLLRLTETTRITSVVFHGCTVEALVLLARGRETWSPVEIRQQLEHAGVVYRGEGPPPGETTPPREPAPELVDLNKLLNYFLKSTTLGENMIRRKLSTRGQTFIDETLPQLLRAEVIIEVENRGGGDQRRFRLGATLQAIDDALAAANGDFEQFLTRFT
jgi:hypothetical protein